MRIDKFLWTVRIFKTRSVATEACRAGRVNIGKQVVKAAKEIKIEDVVDIRLHAFTKTIEIIAFPKSRVGAKLVEKYIKDLTPETEYFKLQMTREKQVFQRAQGSGRPTKKERRKLDNLIDKDV